MTTGRRTDGDWGLTSRTVFVARPCVCVCVCVSRHNGRRCRARSCVFYFLFCCSLFPATFVHFFYLFSVAFLLSPYILERALFAVQSVRSLKLLLQRREDSKKYFRIYILGGGRKMYYKRYYIPVTTQQRVEEGNLFREFENEDLTIGNR